MGMFNAVVVAGGRLFKGECYLVGGEYVQRYGYAGSGVCPLTFTTKVRVWDPKTQKCYWVNEKFVEEREVTPEQRDLDAEVYGKGLISETVNWCRARSEGKPEEEVLRFAHNVLRKRNPELLPLFEKVYGYKEDIAATIVSTVNWAFGLGYRSDKSTRIAARALWRKGITSKPEFDEAWRSALATHNAINYADRFLFADGTAA